VNPTPLARIRGVAALLRTGRANLATWPTFLVRSACRRAAGGAPLDGSVRTRRGSTLTYPETPSARAPIWEWFTAAEEQWARLLAKLPAHPVVVDVGAHIGTFSVAMHERHPLGRGRCVEPAPSALRFLRTNLSENGLAGTVQVMPRALGPVDGQVLRLDDRSASCETVTGRSGAVAVEAISLPSVLSGLERVDLLKIDCEGAEYGAILAAGPQALAGVRRVFLEYHPVDGHTFGELETAFVDAGLSLTWSQDGLGGTAGLGLAIFDRA
jgi:FkbM family methyltransferase